MFGYIRPKTDMLRVGEYAYYRAAYCGLCKSMSQTVSPPASLSLRYDFVFLALLRMLMDETVGCAHPHRCAASPLRAKPMLDETPGIRYAARCGALLAYYGVCDGAADESGVKGLAYRVLQPGAKQIYRKALSCDDVPLPDETVKTQLAALDALQRAGEASPDAAAEPFAQLLSALFCAGISDDAKRRIAAVCGYHIGRFIYLCDAADDLFKDEKSGSYNPFLCAARADGQSAETYLSAHKEQIETTLTMACASANAALQLLNPMAAPPAFACLENILTLGMPAFASEVLLHPGEKRSTSMHGGKQRDTDKLQEGFSGISGDMVNT